MGEKIKKETRKLKDSNAYRICLQTPENSEAIIEAVKKNDFCEIQRLFKKCKVPKADQRDLMIEILECDEGPIVWN